MKRNSVLFVLAAAYAVAIVTWLLLLSTPVSTGGAWQASQALGSWLFAPLWLLGGVALWRNNRRAGTVLLVPLLLFGAGYGRQFLPNWHLLGVDAAQGIPLRVMSWNALFVNENTAAFESTVRELHPDVIAIQEAGIALSADLPRVLGDLYPHQELYPTGSAAGMAILSRHPILAAAPPDFQRGGGGCNCQTVTLDVQGQSVTVINMHPWPPRMNFGRLGSVPVPTSYDTGNQDGLIQQLIEEIEAAESPLLVLGDLNTSERQPNYARLRRHLDDAFAQAGWGLGYTFPNGGRVGPIPLFPFIRIDYVFHDGAWVTHAAWTGAIDGSDHRFVAADLRLVAPTVP